MKEKVVERIVQGITAKEYHEQINGVAAFSAWHSRMFPGQKLEMDPWVPTVAEDVLFPTMARSVMYTMCMDVPYYVRSLTSAFNYIVTVRDEQLVWYDEEKRTVTMYSRPWTVLPILGHMQWSKIWLRASEIADADGTVGVKMVIHGVTHVERAPLGLRRAMEILITSEMVRNITALHRIIGDRLVEYTRLKEEGCGPRPDVAWPFDSPQILDFGILESGSDWHDALSFISDCDHLELEAHGDHVALPRSLSHHRRHRDVMTSSPWIFLRAFAQCEAGTAQPTHRQHRLFGMKQFKNHRKGASIKRSAAPEAVEKAPAFFSMKRHTKALIKIATSPFKRGSRTPCHPQPHAAFLLVEE